MHETGYLPVSPYFPPGCLYRMERIQLPLYSAFYYHGCRLKTTRSSNISTYFFQDDTNTPDHRKKQPTLMHVSFRYQ